MNRQKMPHVTFQQLKSVWNRPWGFSILRGMKDGTQSGVYDWRLALGNKGTVMNKCISIWLKVWYEVTMPRKARIDTPGALHHIIVKSIEWRKIFYDNGDRDHFIERLGVVLTETVSIILH